HGEDQVHHEGQGETARGRCMPAMVGMVVMVVRVVVRHMGEGSRHLSKALSPFGTLLRVTLRCGRTGRYHVQAHSFGRILCANWPERAIAPPHAPPTAQPLPRAGGRAPAGGRYTGGALPCV